MVNDPSFKKKGKKGKKGGGKGPVHMCLILDIVVYKLKLDRRYLYWTQARGTIEISILV